jgi:hypothetical protein
MRFVVGTMLIVFGAAGIFLVSNGVWSLLQTLRRLPHLVGANGVVLKVHSERRFTETNTGGGWRPTVIIVNFPVIQFQTDAGETRSFRSSTGDVGRRSRYRPGQALRILYDPDGQIPPMINSWTGIWFPIVAQSIGGVGFMGGAALIWFAFGDRVLGRIG